MTNFFVQTRAKYNWTRFQRPYGPYACWQEPI